MAGGQAFGMTTRHDLIILTCDRDKRLAELCLAGVEKFWPSVRPIVLHDTDTSTEVSVPDDIRDMARRIPYLRKVFDAPHIAQSEYVYYLDSDCLLFSEPTDFGTTAYQGVPGHVDAPDGLLVWRALGVEFDTIAPCFCAGMHSYRRTDFIKAAPLAIAYLRKCAEWGFDKVLYPGVVCEQSLVAGIWRKFYADNPLDPQRYPIHQPTPEQVIFHIASSKTARATPDYLAAYEASL